MFRRFGTLCSFLIGCVNKKNNWDEIFLFPRSMKVEQTERSETSAHKIQTPGNHPKERMQHSKHGETFKSQITFVVIGRLFCLPVLHITTLCPYLETISPDRPVSSSSNSLFKGLTGRLHPSGL